MTVFPIPAPIRFIPFLMTSCPSQAAAPEGTITVSPGLAAEIAALTSAKEGLAAVMTSAGLTVTVLFVLFEFEPALIVRVTIYDPAA